MNKKFIQDNTNKTVAEVFCCYCNTQLAIQCEYQFGIQCPPCSESLAACQGCYIYRTCAVDNRDPPCSKRFESSGFRGIQGEPGIDFTQFSTKGLKAVQEYIEKELEIRKGIVAETRTSKLEFINKNGFLNC